MQLTLANAMEMTMGTGGLDKRNAMQLLHSIYDLQEAMEIGVWKKEWEKARKKVEGEDTVGQPVPTLQDPILTRWHTVGQAASFLVKHLPICRQISKNIRNWSTSGGSTVISKSTKIASGINSLIEEPAIISDVQLIACFHTIFLNRHLAWLQKGDKKIGDTPGFLGRHMFSRYFLMHDCLQSLMNNGWKEHHGTKLFVQGLEQETMAVTIPDPADPKNETHIPLHAFQERKANAFFKAAFLSLEKHYKRYGDNLLFLSLYDEPHVTKIVAGLLMGEELPNPPPDQAIPSPAHGMDINLLSFLEFAKKKINVQQQKESIFIKECEDVLPILYGKWILA